MTTTWRDYLTEAMEGHGETWDDVLHVVWGLAYDYEADREQPQPPLGEPYKRFWQPLAATRDEFLDREFYAGFGGPEGQPFTLWTHKRVYFAALYDGAEWVASVPRDPCGEVTKHVGRW